MAERELQSAKQILDDNCSLISCSKCHLVLEVTIDQQLGDLSRSQFHFNSIDTENIYKSALHKLSEWKNSASKPEELSGERKVTYASNSSPHCATNHSDTRELPPRSDVDETKIEPKRTRKTRKGAKPIPQAEGQCLREEKNIRMTRSRYRSSQSSGECIQEEVPVGLTNHSKSKHVFAFPDELRHRGRGSDIKCSEVDFGDEATCACDTLKVKESGGSIINFIHMKWEFVRRRLLLRLLTSIGMVKLLLIYFLSF